MAYIKGFNEFLEQLNKEAYNPEIKRMQKLSGITKKNIVMMVLEQMDLNTLKKILLIKFN